jgi:hypothetical protein
MITELKLKVKNEDGTLDDPWDYRGPFWVITKSLQINYNHKAIHKKKVKEHAFIMKEQWFGG